LVTTNESHLYFSNFFSQISSQVAKGITLYFVFTLHRPTTFFLPFKEMTKSKKAKTGKGGEERPISRYMIGDTRVEDPRSMRSRVSETNKQSICVSNGSGGNGSLTFLISFEEVMKESQRSKTIRGNDIEIRRNKEASNLGNNSNRSRRITKQGITLVNGMKFCDNDHT